MSLEVYLEPSQTSTMKLFRENSYRLFPLKSLIVDLRLDSEFASETVILLKKKIKQEKLCLPQKITMEPRRYVKPFTIFIPGTIQLSEKCLNTEFFSGPYFPHSD